MHCGVMPRRLNWKRRANFEFELREKSFWYAEVVVLCEDYLGISVAFWFISEQSAVIHVIWCLVKLNRI